MSGIGQAFLPARLSDRTRQTAAGVRHGRRESMPGVRDRKPLKQTLDPEKKVGGVEVDKDLSFNPCR